MTRRPRPAELAAGVLAGDRAALARAITLIESQNPQHSADARALLGSLLPNTGRALRVGITGVPGVGKSTFIDSLGMMLVRGGHKVAVLAVDPSSSVSGGSILGDKTRMPNLAAEERAFIRPSPSAQSLGGVTRRTRETILACDAAGFDVVLVETVGVGQSETVVAEMVDFFLVLMLPGAGDELQGIKRGILELADLVAVNKADGDNLPRAALARREYAAALHYLRPRTTGWQPRVITVSGLTGDGLAELWEIVRQHHTELESSGALQEQRRAQDIRWMWSAIEDQLRSAFLNHPNVQSARAELERAVRDGEKTATDAASELLRAFGLHLTD
ncbi:MAG: methylmalonyl Co-A mutase-associated GTPase MeaB [Deltaproteobacteria bacterium]|nr:methylmalonyl Co-A mutase-associated GTPase MeaB [Deltaproteobacteria bacterium]